LENDPWVKVYLHLIACELDITTRLLGYQAIVMNPQQGKEIMKEIKDLKTTAFLSALGLLGDTPEEEKIKKDLEKRQKELEEELKKRPYFG